MKTPFTLFSLSLVSILLFSGCSGITGENIEGQTQDDSHDSIEETVDNEVELSSESNTFPWSMWNGEEPYLFRSRLFNVALTIPENIVVTEHALTNKSSEVIYFSFDSEVEIGTDGTLMLSSPALVGSMKATEKMTMDDFLEEEALHNHRDVIVETFERDGKTVNDYSFLANCEGIEARDHLYIVEHEGYLLEFKGHECQDISKIVKTLQFLDHQMENHETEEETLSPANDSQQSGQFMNDDFGISFDYPENWLLEEQNFVLEDRPTAWFRLVNMPPPNDWPGLHEGVLRISFYYEETDQSLEDYFEENDYYVEENLKERIEFWSEELGELNIEDYNAQISSMEVNGQAFLTSSGQVLKKQEGAPSKSRHYYFEIDGKVIIIHATTIIAEGDEALLNQAEEVVKSIGFN